MHRASIHSSGILTMTSKGKKSNMTAQAMDQLCGGALFLQSGSLQGSIVICYEKVNKDLLLGLVGF